MVWRQNRKESMLILFCDLCIVSANEVDSAQYQRSAALPFVLKQSTLCPQTIKATKEVIVFTLRRVVQIILFSDNNFKTENNQHLKQLKKKTIEATNDIIFFFSFNIRICFQQ